MPILVYHGSRILPSCAYPTPGAAAQRIWGAGLYHSNLNFFKAIRGVALRLKEKARQAGLASDFDERQFYAAANLAIRAHVKDGRPLLRKSGEPYVYHMLRILERLLMGDMPYLGGQAYIAAWLHDTVEDTDLSLENIEQVFGARAAGIVETLSKFKVSKFETKLMEADRYDPRFTAKILDFPEALYIKLADVDDYFNTCGPCSELSKFYHFRFVNEVLYPLAVAVIGASAAALNLANKALKIQNPVAYERAREPLERLDEGVELVETVTRIADILDRAGIWTEESGRMRTPYEIYLKQRRAETKFQRVKGHLLRMRPAEEGITGALEARRAEICRLTHRDLVYYDVTVENERNVPRARKALCAAYSAIPERSRDFVTHPKPNGYRGRHEEFSDPRLGPNQYRVKIFSLQMDAVNRLGRGRRVLTASPLLSPDVLDMVQGTDRETRTLILQRLPEVRQIEIRAEGRAYKPWVWRQDNLFDALVRANPLLALKFSQARWGEVAWKVGGKFDAREGFDWFTGQRISLSLGSTWSGCDLYDILHNPLSRRELRRFVCSELSAENQAGLGRSMLGYALGSQPLETLQSLGRRAISLKRFESVLMRRGREEEEWVERSVPVLGDGYVFFALPEIYRRIARGDILLSNAVSALYNL